MKNLKLLFTLIAALFVVLFFVMGRAEAGMWEIVTSESWAKIEPDVSYKLETKGWNTRVYEFTPAYNENVRCIFGAADGASGMACYDVSPNHPEYVKSVE
jgi:hypothetical protein